jgi:DNA-binding transcriptional MocR family regulator
MRDRRRLSAIAVPERGMPLATRRVLPRIQDNPLLTPAGKAELAYQAIRRAIIEQALGPGTQLPEDQLGAQFGVSRTRVRTVLGRLASEALVDIGNKRSALIAELPREGHALGDVLARHRDHVAPPATPLTTTRRRTA